MSKHTPGPWKTEGRYRVSLGEVTLSMDGEHNDRAYRRELVLEPAMKEGGPWHCDKNGGDTLAANAARIVACVNACEGIEDPAVIPDLIDAARGAMQLILETSRGETCGRLIFWRLDELLARVETTNKRG